MTSVKYDPPQVMGPIIGKVSKNPMKSARGVAETRLTVEKLPKDLPLVKSVQHDLCKL